jgi:hypothetical protein
LRQTGSEGIHEITVLPMKLSELMLHGWVSGDSCAALKQNEMIYQGGSGTENPGSF